MGGTAPAEWLAPLDGLRALALLWTQSNRIYDAVVYRVGYDTDDYAGVVEGFGGGANPAGLYRLMRNGELGLSIFLAISGFVVPYGLTRALERARTRRARALSRAEAAVAATGFGRAAGGGAADAASDALARARRRARAHMLPRDVAAFVARRALRLWPPLAAVALAFWALSSLSLIHI